MNSFPKEHDTSTIAASSHHGSNTLPSSRPRPLVTAMAKHLPVFTLQGFTLRLAEAGKREAELKAEWQKERDRKTAFWVTPGLRPLAEAPGVDWKWFSKTYISSDLKHRKLFPNDPEKRCRMKDLDGEQGALREYLDWAYAMAEDSDDDEERRAFCAELAEELGVDYGEVTVEWTNLRAEGTILGQFEIEYLDDDGGTKTLEKRLEAGDLIHKEDEQEVKEKYGYIFDKFPLVEREFRQFESSISNHEGTLGMERLLEIGEVIPYEINPLVQDKYGYLFGKKGKSLLERWERRHLDADGGTTTLEHDFLKDGGDPFWGYGRKVQKKYQYLREKYAVQRLESRYQVHTIGTGYLQQLIWNDDDEEFQALFLGKAVEKYSYLIPTALERFEFEHVSPDGSTRSLEEHLAAGHYMAYEKNEEVQQKYSALFTKYNYLYRFEKNFIETQGGTSTIEKLPRGKWDEVLRRFSDQAVIDKYGHLIPPEPPSKERTEVTHQGL